MWPSQSPKVATPRRGSVWFALLLCVVAALMPSAGPAAVVPLTMEEMVAVADDIVTARVTATEEKFAGRQIVTTAKLEVVESFKGTLSGETEVTYLGGKVGKLVMAAPGFPTLKKGETVTLFLSSPVKRLPAAQQKAYNATSPVVASPQVVGGFQGVFRVMESTQSDAVTKSGAVDLSTGVTRHVNSNGATAAASAPQATYGELRAAIADLVASQKKLSSQKAAPKSIAGVRGSFVIPTKSTHPAVRRFDPLPSIAYSSDEELKAIHKNLDDQAKARAAKKATEKGTTP